MRAIVLVICFATIAACNSKPKYNAAAAAKRSADSMKSVMERRQAYMRRIREDSSVLEFMRRKLGQAEEKLSIEKRKLGKVMAWEQDRSRGEREQEITRQLIAIQSAEDSVASISRNMSDIAEGISLLRNEMQNVQ